MWVLTKRQCHTTYQTTNPLIVYRSLLCMVMSLSTCLGSQHSPYSLYYCHASDKAVVGATFEVFSYIAVLAECRASIPRYFRILSRASGARPTMAEHLELGLLWPIIKPSRAVRMIYVLCQGRGNKKEIFKLKENFFNCLFYR